MTIFERHPRPWRLSKLGRLSVLFIQDARGEYVDETSAYLPGAVDRAIVTAVNAEPELRARIAVLEAENQRIRKESAFEHDAACPWQSWCTCTGGTP